MRRCSILVTLILVCLAINLSFSPDEYLLKSALAQKAKSAGQAVRKELPLTIQRVYLRGNKVYITILRKGGGKIDPGDYSNIRVKVVAGSGKLLRHWSLSEVDRKKVLVGTSGRVEFDTGIVLKERETVKAILTHGKWETSKQNVLLPVQSHAGTPKTVPDKMASQTPLQDQKTAVPAPPPPKDTSKTRPLMGSRSQAAMPSTPPAKPVPLRGGSGGTHIMGGIRITSPTSAHDWYAGTAVTVRYRFTREASSGPVTFSLFNRDTNRLMDETSHNYTPSFGDRPGFTPPDSSFTWNLPGDLLRSDNYYIRARGCGFWGESDTFSIHPLPDRDLGGTVHGIEVIQPRGGEAYRPGGTLTVRYRYTHPERTRPEHVNISLRFTELTDVAEGSLTLESGSDLPETDIVYRIAPSLGEGQYVINISGGGLSATSRAFTITSSSPSFGDIAGSSARPQLRVISPGIGGEHWLAGSEHTVRWRFFPGGERVPGTWLVTLLKYNPSFGYRIDRSFTPPSCDIREVIDGGLTWLEHNTQWTIPGDVEAGDYKIRVSGLGHRDDGHFNFTIGSSESTHWDLHISNLSRDNTNLIAYIQNTGGVSGAVEFLVEVLDARTVVSSRRVTIPIPARSGPVILGTLESLGADLSRFDCGIDFQVTVDSDNRIEEWNVGEENNVRRSKVYVPERIGKATVNSIRYGVECGDDVLEDGSEITGRSGSRIFCFKLSNCGTYPANGRVVIRQKGEWIGADSRRLTPDYHEEVIYDQSLILDPGGGAVSGGVGSSTSLVISTERLRAVVDSDLEIRFEGNFAEWADSPVTTIHFNCED